jgi:hypothetical protein
VDERAPFGQIRGVRRWGKAGPVSGAAFLVSMILAMGFAGCKSPEKSASRERQRATPASPTSKLPAAKSGEAKLAILIDDLGSDRAAAEKIFALPYPMTISVLPEHPQSVEIANEARRRGCEVLLHLPMQSVGKDQREPQELEPGMTSARVSAMVDRFLVDVPGVRGINNHQGSQATADPALMAELMRIICFMWIVAPPPLPWPTTRPARTASRQDSATYRFSMT